MSPADRNDGDEALDAAVRAMRADVPVRAEWRRELLAELERTQRERRWSVRPFVAIAAAIGFVLLGVGISQLVGSRASPNARESVAQMAAGAPDASATAAAVRFLLVSEDAQRVSLVGDFNGWNAASLPLQRGADGRSWTIEVRLPPGRYAYAFSVDGRLVADPAAPRSADEDFGVPTSVALVSEHRS